MNKRISSLLLCLAVIAVMLASAVPVLAAGSSCTYTVEADKTTAIPGDTITFTVYMQQTGTQTTLEAHLVIPSGLTFVDGSGVLTSGIKEKLGWDAVDWTPDPSKILNGYGAEAYTGTEKLALMTFKCTVDSAAAPGDYTVDLSDLVADDKDTNPKENISSVPATIAITAAPKPATGISLNKTTLSLTVGGSEQLNATVEPADTTDTVQWSSDKATIAKVDNTGKVTAEAPGTAIITAKAGSKTATCTVTVTAAPKPATGITLDKTSLALIVGGSEQLTAKPEPADTTDTVQWSSGNTDVATVDGTGKVTAVGIGTAIITAKVGDHTAECTVDVVKTVRIELPYKLVVKKTGEMDPGKETFKFIAEDFGAPTNFTLVQDSIMTEGEKTYDGKFIFDIPEMMLGNLSEGFRFRQVKGDAAGWTYDEKVYYVVPKFENDGLSGWRFFNADEIPGDPSVSEPAPDVIEELVFTNSYNAKKPVDPPTPQQPEVPKTGDSSMLGLWLALLFVSGAAVATTILIVRMKKTNS